MATILMLYPFQILVSASDDNSVRVWGPAAQYRHAPAPAPAQRCECPPSGAV